MGNQEVRFKLDSGADANVLPLDTYERLGSGSPLMKTNTVLTAFGNAKIRPEGEVKLPVVNPHTSETRMLDFYVTRSSDIAILGCKACIELDLVRMSVDTVAENDVLTEEKCVLSTVMCLLVLVNMRKNTTLRWTAT